VEIVCTSFTAGIEVEISWTSFAPTYERVRTSCTSRTPGSVSHSIRQLVISLPRSEEGGVKSTRIDSGERGRRSTLAGARGTSASERVRKGRCRRIRVK
jgi:hypothetical protein